MFFSVDFFCWNSWTSVFSLVEMQQNGGVFHFLSKLWSNFFVWPGNSLQVLPPFFYGHDIQTFNKIMTLFDDRTSMWVMILLKVCFFAGLMFPLSPKYKKCLLFESPTTQIFILETEKNPAPICLHSAQELSNTFSLFYQFGPAKFFVLKQISPPPKHVVEKISPHCLIPPSTLRKMGTLFCWFKGGERTKKTPWK